MPVHDVLHVIQISLGGALYRDALLSPDELEHAGRFVFERDRRRYVNAHVQMRRTIGRFASTEPHALKFHRGNNGKPFLTLPGLDVRFNLSHSGEYAVLGLTVGRELGIDIEQHRDLDVEALSKDVFSLAEQRALAQLPRQERLAAFYRGWTRKESFIKALGDGLQFPLTKFDVNLAQRGSPILLACRHNATEAFRWSIGSLPSPKASDQN